MERIFDLFFSLTALAILSPLVLPIIFILRLTGEGEIFFLQERVGKHGKIFKLFKFATMLKDSPNIGTGEVTVKSDPRILPVGYVLRKFKINELPQLLNVFLGHMSLIGPRPLTKTLFDCYPKNVQKAIKSVRPGLSGIGSIVFRSEEDILQGDQGSRNFYQDVILKYKGSLEEWFVMNKSMYVYFLAIFITIWVIFFSNSTIVFKIFQSLPPLPSELGASLKKGNK